MKDKDKINAEDFCGGFDSMEPEDLESFEDNRVGIDEEDDLDELLREYGI